jgi:GxxExxY protein
MLIHRDISDKILRAFYDVFNELGSGQKEICYENALAFELSRRGLEIEQQKQITVYYAGIAVGHHRPDLIVEDKVIVELKAAPVLCQAHVAQLLHYLRATTFEVGLLLNFGNVAEFERRVYSNSRKHRPKK